MSDRTRIASVFKSRRPAPTSRRFFLSSVGLAGGALAAARFLPAFVQPARASGWTVDTMPIVIFCSFEGGWDTLCCLDPRDNTTFGADSGVTPAYEEHRDDAVQAVLAANGSGLVQPNGSNIIFGPAIGDLAQHYEDLCVVRGIDMGTLTHEVGRRYLLTGKFPRGLAASGSSLTTWTASEVGNTTPVPNLVVGMESYNEGLEVFATGLQINSADDMQLVLNRLGTDLSATARAAVDDYAAAGRCWDQILNGDDAVQSFNDSRAKAAELASGTLASHFDFTTTPSAEIREVYEHFALNTGNTMLFGQELSSAAGQAAIAAQAITHGVSQVVSIRLATGIDDHTDTYASNHATALREGFDALAKLIDWLKSHTDANGQPFWSRTTIIATSEFARTPKINGRGGRDHHLANAVVVAGPGIVGNQVIGGTTDDTYAVRPVDLATGGVSDSGELLRPPDVHATLLSSMGLGYDHLDNQDPRIISAMLR